ncbi:MAG TPA: M18 family aminopeptidase [Spirochaetia bacterium]|nr:M18 family aminopeptidase [Spirochaetales bacterium]HRY80111.1 M18 family aminopeptidase [Spirochaetia bacterium]HRZ88806.1 M18 family aminopeptidase [Spirochaetia bacterium]
MPAVSAKSLCDFLDASPTQFHAADALAAALQARGALALDERSEWNLEPGRTYYVVRNGSGLVAFRIGGESPARTGFALAGAHTDAPALRVRPEKSLRHRAGDRIAVEVYGGPILSTWLDRPLALAGRAAVRGSDGRPELRLVNPAGPAAVIPNLAIHLNREVNKGFEYNVQNHLPALVAAPLADRRPAEGDAPWALAETARNLGVPVRDILGAELFLVDASRAVILGRDGELVNSGRIDNLAGCHAILAAFNAAPPGAHGQAAVFFDNEEIGSGTRQGADGLFLRDVLARVCARSGCDSEGFYRALAASFCVSVDAAQGWHPNFQEKYDEAYSPVLNGGPAVKANANFKYATDAESEARFRACCEDAAVPCQKFAVRADLTPGSTIGPLSSALSGIRTVDVGSPLLAMHSIRETAGSYDHDFMTAALRRFYEKGPGA